MMTATTKHPARGQTTTPPTPHVAHPQPRTNRTPSALALATATAFACTAAAQITISGSTYQPIAPIQFGQVSSAAASLTPNPNAAFSNVTVGANVRGSGGSTFSDKYYDDLTADPASVGQQVRSLRIAVSANYNRPVLPPNSPEFVQMRLQIAFWNADGLSAIGENFPGTPLMNGGSQAAYITEPIDFRNFQWGAVTIPLGNAGFTIPSGKFWVGLALEALPGSSVFDSGIGLYTTPTVGTSSSRYWSAGVGSAPGGLPFGSTFAPLGAQSFPGSSFAGGLGIELVVPTPGSVAVGLLSMSLLTRRHRRR